MSPFVRLAAVAMLAGLALTPMTAIGQTAAPSQPAETYGDWLLRCVDDGTVRCVLSQRIVNSESRSVVAEIGIARLANGDEGYALVLSVPEGADLSAAPAFRLDGAPDQTAMAWRVCANSMCRASASLSADAAAAMSEAGRGIFGYKKYRASELTLTPVSYAGLAEGLAAMDAK